MKNLSEDTEFQLDWIKTYRGPENVMFDEIAFDYCTEQMHRVGGRHVLDAGCGTCHKSIKLAQRNLQVTAIDFSGFAVREGSRLVEQLNLVESIDVQLGDLTRLSFSDNTFDHVLCWGVLMHIPEVGKALAELSRVIKPGGALIIGELNCFAPELRLNRLARTALGLGQGRLRKTELGYELWTRRSGVDLMTRALDPEAFLKLAVSHRLKLQERRAGEFTELYGRARIGWVRRLLHLWNVFWFKCFGWPSHAVGNIFVFHKVPPMGPS